MNNYVDSTSPEYVRRMTASLGAKWAALEPYVTPGARILDYGCGMPVDGGIRELVEAAGGVYECHDISATVETAMRDAGATFRTREDLQERAGGYDVVFLSSVMHEILAGENWFEDLEFIRDLAAPSGVLIVRDWAGPNYQIDNEVPKSLKVVSEDAMREVLTWVGALSINKITRFKGKHAHPVNWDTLEIYADPTSLYEIASIQCGVSTVSLASPQSPTVRRTPCSPRQSDGGESTSRREDTTSGTKPISSTSSASTTSTACRGRRRPSSSCAATSNRHNTHVTLI